MNSNSFSDRLINSHSEAVHKSKSEGQSPSEHIFGFRKTFKKITKNLGFDLTFKTADLQKFLFTSIPNEIEINTNSLYLYVLVLVSDNNTQVMFNGLMNLIKIIIQSHIIPGIQNVNYQPMVINFKSILVVRNMLIVLNN